MFFFARFSPPLLEIDTALLVLAFGWFLAGVGRAFRERRWGSAALFAPVLAMGAWTAWIWWNDADSQDWRPLVATFPLVALALASLGWLWRSDRIRIILTLSSFVAIGNYGLWAVLSRLPPFGMQDDDTMSIAAPGGRYTAQIVNHDGLTYGYDYLALRPGTAEFGTLLDRPRRYVAEFVMEQDVTGLRWNSANDLTVLLRPKADVAWKKTSWRGLAIHYQIDPHAEASR